jgi:uncharacterized protein YjiS (DUF1127 family)
LRTRAAADFICNAPSRTMMIPSPLEAALDVKRALAATGLPPALAASPIHASTAIASLWRTDRDLWQRLLLNWRRWQLRRATFAALQSLDRRTLSDLGIDRSELWSAADAVARGGDATRLPRARWMHGR